MNDAEKSDRVRDDRQPDTSAEEEPVATILVDDPADSLPPKMSMGKDRQAHPQSKTGTFAKDGATPSDAKAPLTTAVPAEDDTPHLPVSVDSATSAPHSAYARGFGLSIGVAAALAGFYLIAPSISGPGALGGFAAEYRSAADQGRVWLGDTLGLSGSGD